MLMAGTELAGLLAGTAREPAEVLRWDSEADVRRAGCGGNVSDAFGAIEF